MSVTCKNTLGAIQTIFQATGCGPELESALARQGASKAATPPIDPPTPAEDDDEQWLEDLPGMIRRRVYLPV